MDKRDLGTSERIPPLSMLKIIKTVKTVKDTGENSSLKTFYFRV